ncbi:integrase [Agrobacterium tumefaciens]|nr:integrase [Agrobacterium tumefaciens]
MRHFRRYGPPVLAASPSSSLCLSQGSSRRASARREESFQPKDLGWLDSCDEHRNEGEV